MATTATDPFNTLTSPCGDIDQINGDHSKLKATSSSSPSAPLPFNPSQDHGGTTTPPSQIQQEGDDLGPHVGGSSWELSTAKHESSTVLKFSFNSGKKEDRHSEDYSRENISMKWMSSKMRLMRKMMSSDQASNAENPAQNRRYEKHSFSLPESNSSSSSSSNNNIVNIRVCSDCNTTKTPLWRSGPRGPKSLCNACGIRQRKARRAMAAAAAAVENGTASPTARLPSAKRRNKKRSKFEATAPTVAPPRSKKKLQFDDFALSLRENSAFYHPHDEREAAILLMALSCGLVHG